MEMWPRVGDSREGLLNLARHVQIALHFGADDFGGTLQEENVHAAARFINKTSTEECIQMIHDAGFAAAQRNTVYDILRTYEVPSAAA